jgi:hypothetical protein
MVAVVRVGDKSHKTTSVAAGVALPVYVDYYRVRPDVAAFFSIALPTQSGVTSTGKYAAACTLGAGINSNSYPEYNYNTEGFPANAADGSVGMLPCYDVPVGNILIDDSGADLGAKVIATINGRHQADTTVTSWYSRYPMEANNGWRSLASPNGKKFYTASVAYENAGFRYIPDATKFTADGATWDSRQVFSLTGTLDARAVVLFDGKLYGMSGPLDGAGFNTIFSMGSGSAPVNPTSSYTALSGMTALGQAWAFVFADASTVWVSSEQGPVKGTVQMWSKVGTAFTAGLKVQFAYSPVYTLAGRVEFDSFVLYGASSSKLYRYDTVGVPAKVTKPAAMATAPLGTVFRGVLFPGRASASPSPRATVSPSKGAPKSTSRSKVSAICI